MWFFSATLDELEVWAKEHQATKKKLVEDIYKLRRELAEATADLSKHQDAFKMACMECDRAIDSYVRAKKALTPNSNNIDRTEVKKLKAKAKAALEKSAKTQREYAKEVADTNKHRAHVSSKVLPELLGGFKSLEGFCFVSPSFRLCCYLFCLL